MDISKLFDVVYRNMHGQLEHYGIQHGQIEQACVATAMDVLLATMRHNDSYKKHKMQNNSKEVQTGEVVADRIVEDPVTNKQPEEPEIVYIPAGAESEDDDIQLLD